MHVAPLNSLSLAVFVAVTAIATIVCVRRPAWAVALLLFVEPFDWMHAIGRTTISIPKVVLIGLVLGLIVRRASLRILWRPSMRLVLVGAAALVAADALSAIPGLYIDAVIRETLKATEYLVVLASCAVALDADPDPGALRISLFAVVSSVTVLALVQIVTGAPSAAVVHGHVIPRIAGPLEGPNQLSGYLGLAIPLLVALAIDAHDRLAASVAILATIGLALTLSRGGIIATAVAVGIVFAVGNRRISRRSWITLITGSVLVIGTLLATGALGRFGSTGDLSTPGGLATRTDLWRAAIALWHTSPWLGVGAGNYELLLPTVGLEGVRTHANSYYLQALAEGGIPSLAAVLFSTIVTIVVIGKMRKNPWALGVMAAAIGLALHQIVDFLTFYPKVGDTYWTLVAIAISIAVARSSALPTGDPSGQKIDPIDDNAEFARVGVHSIIRRNENAIGPNRQWQGTDPIA